MRLRAAALLLAALAACAIAPAAGSAAESPLPYSVDVTADQAAALAAKGFDLDESGYDSSKQDQTQEIGIIATPSEVAGLKRDGISAAPIGLDKPVAKSKALG